ncbi:MAG TPA: hypothetical protein VIP53_03065 [Nitrososphaera sp.]
MIILQTLRVAIARRKMQIAIVRTATPSLMFYLELFYSKRKRTLNASEKEKME